MPINVRCYFDSDINVRRSEVTVRAIFGLGIVKLLTERAENCARSRFNCCSPFDWINVPHMFGEQPVMTLEVHYSVLSFATHCFVKVFDYFAAKRFCSDEMCIHVVARSRLFCITAAQTSTRVGSLSVIITVNNRGADPTFGKFPKIGKSFRRYAPCNLAGDLWARAKKKRTVATVSRPEPTPWSLLIAQRVSTALLNAAKEPPHNNILAIRVQRAPRSIPR